MSYLIHHAAAIRNTGILRVMPLEDDLGKNRIFQVAGDPARKVAYRASRVLFDRQDQLRDEFIMIIERPSFEITTLIGERIVPTG